MFRETCSSVYVVRSAIYVVKSTGSESRWSSQVSKFITRLFHSQEQRVISMDQLVTQTQLAQINRRGKGGKVIQLLLTLVPSQAAAWLGQMQGLKALFQALQRLSRWRAGTSMLAAGAAGTARAVVRPTTERMVRMENCILK